MTLAPKTLAQDQYKALGEQVQAVQAEQMQVQLATFKGSLEEFAINHRCASLYITWQRPSLTY